VKSSIIYLDESGDLGWAFDAPYRKGGSSRHLTITGLCVPAEKNHIPERVVRDLYKQFGWKTSRERKWVDMGPKSRTAFANEAAKMCAQHKDIHLHAMVVKKQNVGDHIRKDPNKLYNFMIQLLLIDCMSLCDAVKMVPDPRSIKVRSGNSLHDYLQTQLWFTKNVKTVLTTKPTDSQHCLGIQFADMLAGVVQARYEDTFFDDFKVVYPKMDCRELFFK